MADDQAIEKNEMDDIHNLKVQVRNDLSGECERSVIVLDDESKFLHSGMDENPESTELFRFSFSETEKFHQLKTIVQNAISDCLEKNDMPIDFYEDERNLEICVFEKFKEASQKNTENEQNLIFSIDTTPAKAGCVEPRTIPSYKRTIQKVLDDEKKCTDEDEKAKRLKAANTCFNCSGDHSLKDCSEPKNQQRINRARKSFKGSKAERYHVDIEQRFAHLKPGVVSEGLRRALGLRKRHLPSFIYKMRVLGYPPGWLEEAKVANSGITLFDSKGQKVLASDDEEGEIDEDKHKYDITKIISFPGFNVNPETDYIEESRHYGVPLMTPRDCKERFINSLRGNIATAYKRKKLKNLSESAAPLKNTETDMEIEDAGDLMLQPFPPIPLPPLPPSSKDVKNAEGENKSRNSPTLFDLEVQKKQLMEALNSSTISDLNKTADDSRTATLIDLDNSMQDSDQIKIESEKSNSSIIIDCDSSLNSNELNSPTTPHIKGSAKLSTLGTPILKFSLFDNLPAGEQFSKGVSDIINFENLPDSTGKYEQMKVVLKKVRKQLSTEN